MERVYHFPGQYLPKLLFAINTSAPLCFAPYAMALPAPPAPITTKVRPESGDLAVLLLLSPEKLQRIS